MNTRLLTSNPENQGITVTDAPAHSSATDNPISNDIQENSVSLKSNYSKNLNRSFNLKSFIAANHHAKQAIEEKLKLLNSKAEIFIEAQVFDKTGFKSTTVYDSKRKFAREDFWDKLFYSKRFFDNYLGDHNHYLIAIHTDYQRWSDEEISGLNEIFNLLKHDTCKAKFYIAIDDYATLSEAQFSLLITALKSANIDELLFCRGMTLFDKKVFYSLTDKIKELLINNLPNMTISYGEYVAFEGTSAASLLDAYKLSETQLAAERGEIFSAFLNINEEKVISHDEPRQLTSALNNVPELQQESDFHRQESGSPSSQRP